MAINRQSFKSTMAATPLNYRSCNKWRAFSPQDVSLVLIGQEWRIANGFDSGRNHLRPVSRFGIVFLEDRHNSNCPTLSSKVGGILRRGLTDLYIGVRIVPNL
jgi:hypothetical protein